MYVDNNLSLIKFFHKKNFCMQNHIVEILFERYFLNSINFSLLNFLWLLLFYHIAERLSLQIYFCKYMISHYIRLYTSELSIKKYIGYVAVASDNPKLSVNTLLTAWAINMIFSLLSINNCLSPVFSSYLKIPLHRNLQNHMIFYFALHFQYNYNHILFP